MATYTSAQLYGSGSLTELLSGNKNFRLTNHGNNGSAYFTMETVRNATGSYDSTSLTNALGVYSNFLGMSGDNMVTSSYIASFVLPQGSSSFQFNSTADVEAGTSYLRATGNVTLVIT